MNKIPGLSQPLTPREEDIRLLVGEGHTNHQIAEDLILALSTVKWYACQKPGAA